MAYCDEKKVCISMQPSLLCFSVSWTNSLKVSFDENREMLMEVMQMMIFVIDG